MSQLREHLTFTIFNHLRFLFQGFRLGGLGKGVHIDKNVRFMRFPKNITVGEDVVVKEGARICSCNNAANIRVGARSTIGYHTYIFSSKQITIGEDCLIAPFVYIVDSNHQIEKHKPINQQANTTSAILIGNDVWIASNSTILMGVTIGNGAVIAANSLVNTNIPENEIWAGVPAKKIGERK